MPRRSSGATNGIAPTATATGSRPDVSTKIKNQKTNDGIRIFRSRKRTRTYLSLKLIQRLVEVRLFPLYGLHARSKVLQGSRGDEKKNALEEKDSRGEK